MNRARTTESCDGEKKAAEQKLKYDEVVERGKSQSRNGREGRQ
jgi:hypothetical protein